MIPWRGRRIPRPKGPNPIVKFEFQVLWAGRAGQELLTSSTLVNRVHSIRAPARPIPWLEAWGSI